ncbi:MAG: hypothetical protein ABIP17_12930 [Ilumatobacteraceae bacterium]
MTRVIPSVVDDIEGRTSVVGGNADVRSVHPSRDCGAADALGLVVLVAPMMLFAVLVFFLGRGIDVNAQLRAAAEASAQAAALERDPVSARAAAVAAATAMLDRTDCATPTVAVDYPIEAPAAGIDVELVEVTVTCGVPNDGYEAFQSGDVSRSARAAATIDYFRAQG